MYGLITGTISPLPQATIQVIPPVITSRHTSRNVLILTRQHTHIRHIHIRPTIGRIIVCRPIHGQHHHTQLRVIRLLPPTITPTMT